MDDKKRERLTNCVTGLPTVVKLVDKETLLKEREEKKKVWNPSRNWEAEVQTPSKSLSSEILRV